MILKKKKKKTLTDCVVIICLFQGSSIGVYEEVSGSHQEAAGSTNEEAKCEGDR